MNRIETIMDQLAGFKVKVFYSRNEDEYRVYDHKANTYFTCNKAELVDYLNELKAVRGIEDGTDKEHLLARPPRERIRQVIGARNTRS